MAAATPTDASVNANDVGAVAMTNDRKLHVSVQDAIPAGTNVIGHVIADSGSTTAVTGDVTVVQPTGTNLHVVVDTAPSTAVTNAGTFAVQDAAAEASLSVLDDWDESDRAKVNLIVGQAGVDGNSGNKSAATLRVVIATDQPQLTNKILVTPDANSAVNVAQINGVTPLMGAGNTGTGSPRVTIASDQASIPVAATLQAGTALVGYIGGKNTYAAKATITWTGTSLANGSARESTVIDNTSNRYRDVLLRFQHKGQASGTNYIDWYVYEALGDTTYTDGATGSDAAFTAANRLNSRYLGSIRCNATTATQGCLKLSDVFNTIPDKWGLIGINNTGAALSATGGDHVIEYEGVY
jgi:hypothetical protein